MFAGDIPRRDQPLPRFIDDAAAAKLLRAAREHPDPFTRLAVEFLARIGLRKGEFLDLTVDSVVQIGAAYWLHVPLGKLRTDRYIPLHPQLKDLLDAWISQRPAGLREPWLFIERGRRIGKQRVGDAIATAAAPAPSGWTATSNRSANHAPTSRSRTTSARRSSVNATTPPTRAKSGD
jgi:integrase